MRLSIRVLLIALAFSVCTLLVSGQSPQKNIAVHRAQNSTPTAEPNEVPNSKGATSAAVPENQKLQTFVGKVSDVNCGPRHFMLANATDAECTRACFARRGLYGLVVGNKVYALENQPGAILSDLAGQQARVTGSLMNADTIEIASVSPAGK